METREYLADDMRGTSYNTYMQYADAKVNTSRGVVECSTIDPKQWSIEGWPVGIYHGGDYELYFESLKTNV
jgi:hypothetical protein